MGGIHERLLIKYGLYLLFLSQMAAACGGNQQSLNQKPDRSISLLREGRSCQRHSLPPEQGANLSSRPASALKKAQRQPGNVPETLTSFDFILSISVLISTR